MRLQRSARDSVQCSITGPVASLLGARNRTNPLSSDRVPLACGLLCVGFINIVESHCHFGSSLTSELSLDQ
eukprot:1428509-Amphidinium_carterae.1